MNKKCLLCTIGSVYLERCGGTLHIRDGLPGLDKPPKPQRTIFLLTGGETWWCNSSSTSTSSAISIAPMLFDIGPSGVSAFSSERSTCHDPSALASGILPCVCTCLVRPIPHDRPDRPDRLATEKSPLAAPHRDLAVSWSTPSSGRQICLMSACGQPYLMPEALTLTARPDASIGCHKRSAIYFVSSHGTPRLCQSKEYAWNLPLQPCPGHCIA